MITKIAQCGVGYWGPNLLRNLVANSRCKLSGVVETSPQRREFISAQYPAIPIAEDVSQILSDPEIDAIILATPAGTHFELAMRCLQAGKHILVEKPLATSVYEVDQIGELAAKKGLVVMAAHTFIFNDAVRYLKELLRSGEIGDIRYIYSRRLNLGRIRTDVDALWNLAPHDVSIIQYLLDDMEPDSIFRAGMAFIQPDIEDVTFLSLIYPGKIMAQVHVSWLDPHKIRELTVVGSKKMVVYDDIAENKITIYDKGIEPKAVLGEGMVYDKPQLMHFIHRNGEMRIPNISFREPLMVEIDHFLDCVQNGVECQTGIEHAKGVVRILERATKEK